MPPDDQESANAIELDDVLLDAKLSARPLRPGSVSRTELIGKARASGCRLVGVTAPAGYGKSTLLAEWAHTEKRPVAWVSLDRLDDDPNTLLALLASAYVRASATSPDLIADVGGPGVSVLGRAAPRLASAFRNSPGPFVVMLDDLHEVQSPACHDALNVVIDGIPPGSQMVAASRFEQPHLPRLRATGDAFELLSSDLALDAVGAAAIFANAKISIDREQAAAVAKRTEGWPVGLYLAAMIARDGDGDVMAVSGQDRYVSDYLYRESLTRMPEVTQRFLRQTAVLDQLSAPLCDALTGESDSQQRLRALESSSTFLVPLDRRREWFRYHALFREFLLGELNRVEPVMVEKLHVRAADWYEANGSPALALEHLLHTTERDRCVQLVSQLVLPSYQAGQLATVDRWLAQLGYDAIEGYPPLAVLAGWIATLSGHVAETQRWAAFIDAASFDQTPVDGSASFESGRAMLRSLICASGPDQALADANFAVAAEPPWSPWRGVAMVVAGEAYLLTGDNDAAARHFAESSAAAAVDYNTDNLIVSESELALLAMDGGRWSDAEQHLDRALSAVDEHRMHDYVASLLAFAGAARLSLHHGDLKETNRRLTQAMRARPSCNITMPAIAVRLRLQLAQVHWALADRSTARHLIREIDDILLQRPAVGTLVDQVSEFRERLSSSTQVGATGASPLSPAELRLLPYLQTHLTIKEIGERLFVSRNTVSSEVSSIYRKLGVSSRNDAVEQATGLGLIGG